MKDADIVRKVWQTLYVFVFYPNYVSALFKLGVDMPIADS